ncbi:IclR family transcriptional regulator [Marinobacterium rhizophilum]|uniref:IclR family transcriptional regulator n=1 Tax=Marinobacterium rhizophilum TaxID=420402 RepID=A0ABY5HHE3_9GAMM|nr:IclR family transcriptional regulator [Marinobacterium rhizophilum]UTW10714.1 IclR family transcriptional regulator [Marinobacterium rhizophilum]
MTAAKNSDGTVGKALNLLDQVAAIGHPVRFSDLLTNSEHPKATLYRLLQTLTSQGMLSYDPDRQLYSLGVRLVKLAHAAWRQSSLAPIARPFLDELSHKLGETVHLAQLDHGQVLYLDKRNPAKPLMMFSDAGKIGPGYCTGVGKAMLAFLKDSAREQCIKQQAYHRYTDNTLTSAQTLRAELDEIRVKGIAFDREEHEPNIICIAAPILSGSDRVLGGLSITTSTQRYTLQALENFKPDLLETARKIAEQADLWQFPEIQA